MKTIRKRVKGGQMEEETKKEIMQQLASFLRYKVQDNIIMELDDSEMKDTKEFILGLEKDIVDCGGGYYCY